MSDFDFEPIPGLPAYLPKGERLLWQGAPDWRHLSRSAFHARKIAIYFAILAVWSAATALTDARPILDAAGSALWLLGLGSAAVALAALLGWLTAKTTVYTITSRRLVMRIGIALPMTLNIPFSRIESAALKSAAGGRGDIAVTLLRPERIAFLVLWPHARPWKLGRPQPMLRALPNADRVAATLAGALAACLETAEQDAAATKAAPDCPTPAEQALAAAAS